jgi:hypothetical protein
MEPTTTTVTQIVIWAPYETDPHRYTTVTFAPAVLAADAVAAATRDSGLGTDAHILAWDTEGNVIRGHAWELLPPPARNTYLYTLERGKWRKVVPQPVTATEAFRMVQAGIAVAPDAWWRVAYDTTDFGVVLEGKPAPEPAPTIMPNR